MIESPNLATGTDVALTVVPPAVGPTVSLKERVIRGVLWLTATRASGQVISWIITIFVVRLLSPEDYGDLAYTTLFNLAALQDVRDTLSLRSLGLSSLRGSLPRTETHAI